MLIFSPTVFLGFRTHVVATTVCTTGGVHTLTCCTHIFLRTARSPRTSHTSHACHIHAWLKGAKKVLCTCVVSLHLAFSLLMFHPSLLLLYILFDITFQSTILPYLPLPVSKTQDTRNSAHASRSLANWPSQMQTQVMSPTSSIRSLPWTLTRCSSTIRTTISPTAQKPRTRTQDCSVFSQCLNRLFRTFLLVICFSNRKQRKHAIGKPLLDREKEKKEKGL